MDTFEEFINSKIESLEGALKTDFEYLTTFSNTKNGEAAFEKSRDIVVIQTQLKVYIELLSIYHGTR